jgi:hypothetical protein
MVWNQEKDKMQTDLEKKFIQISYPGGSVGK